LETKSYCLIENIRKALMPKYEFPYYALVRIHTTHYGTIHVPAPFFNGVECNPRSQWAGSLPISSDKRDGEYYECPFCGERSYYAGVCQNCRRDFEVWDEEEEQWVDGELPIEYKNNEALKASVKEEILYRIDHRMPTIGIVSAEIVLSETPSNVCGENHSPFMKSSSWDAQQALDRIEEVIRNMPQVDGDPLDYIEGDEIHIEGSDEVRRQVNGAWQHKHPESGYDYWHPLGRVHKGSNVYPIGQPYNEV
jgi:hypothetical protein